MDYTRKFVSWDVPKLDALKDRKAYQLRQKLNNGEKLNRILGEKRYTLSCRTDKRKSLEMFEILQNHYNPDKDIDKAIKLHNPKASQSYRTKIMEQIEIIKINLSYNEYI